MSASALPACSTNERSASDSNAKSKPSSPDPQENSAFALVMTR
jgi:hypothetical protein